MKTAVAYTESVAIVVAVAALAHYLVGLDWPWAIVAGAVASMLERALVHRKPAARL